MFVLKLIQMWDFWKSLSIQQIYHLLKDMRSMRAFITSAKKFFDKVPNNPVSFVWLVFMQKYTTEAVVNGH